jgi:exosortase/archaeosortase family protein
MKKTPFSVFLVGGVVVALLAQLASAQDSFSHLSRPLVLGLLQLGGLHPEYDGEGFRLGRLDIPWSRDCAGLNLFIVLLGVILWHQRKEPLRWPLALRLAATLPLALVANVLRVMILIAYREISYPSVESPQLHYFLGLACLIPFALLLLPRTGRPRRVEILELTHTSAVLALLIPMMGGPGGWTLGLAVMFCLAHCRVCAAPSRLRNWLTWAWLTTGALIALAGIESLWMPWMLACPLLAGGDWFRRPVGWILWAATYPLFSLLPGVEWIVVAALVFAFWRSFAGEKSVSTVKITETTSPFFPVLLGVSLLAFTLPFLASVWIGETAEILKPPAEAASLVIPGGGFELQLPDQSPDLALLWYTPNGNGRHHTIQVCMRYRGVELETIPGEKDLYTDGQHWIREYYLQGGRLLENHLDYVKSTLVPRSAPGVHLILLTPKDTMPARQFNREARWLVQDLRERLTPVARTSP